MPQPQASASADLPTPPTSFGPDTLWGWPLHGIPHGPDRLLARLIARLALAQVVEIRDWERLLPEQDPFILVANHGSRREALYLAALCLVIRGGKPVRFLADWNFRLYPGVGYLYERSGAITVTTKSARPRILNRLKPRFTGDASPIDQARATLRGGGSVGIFPEGTVNRSPSHLLPGRLGAARLSLELGVPLLPVGLRFHGRPRRDGCLDSNAPMSIAIGRPLTPPPAPYPVPSPLVRQWHRTMMIRLATQCDKVWTEADAGADDLAAPPSMVSGPAQRARGGSLC